MVVTYALSLQLFANRPVSESPSFPENRGNGSDWLNANLYPLYLEGATKAAFSALLKQIKADGNQKIVFQFFYQKNDLLQERIDREQKVIFFDLCPVCWSE